MELEVRGMDRAIARVYALRQAVPRAALGAMAAGGALVFAESLGLVPKRTGALAFTGRVSPIVDNGNEHSLTISYGPLRYSCIVHYNNHLRHLTGRSYFVIDPMHAMASTISDMQATAIRAAANAT